MKQFVDPAKLNAGPFVRLIWVMARFLFPTFNGHWKRWTGYPGYNVNLVARRKNKHRTRYASPRQSNLLNACSACDRQDASSLARQTRIETDCNHAMSALRQLRTTAVAGDRKISRGENARNGDAALLAFAIVTTIAGLAIPTPRAGKFKTAGETLRFTFGNNRL